MEAPQAEISVVGRMVRVFYAPSETFEAVSERRTASDWLVPILIVAAVIFVSSHLTASIYVAEAVEQAKQQMPADQDGATENIEAFVRISGLIGGLIGTLGMLFISAAIYLLIGKLIGGLLNYGQCLAIIAYTSLISVLEYIVRIPLVLANETMDVQIGLGMFLSEEALKSFGGALLSFINPFLVWTVVVAGLGLSIVGQIERSRAYASVAAITLIFLAIISFFSTLNAGG